MSEKEVDRLSVIKEVYTGQIKTKDAAELLGITDRQIRRILRRYGNIGKAALVSGHRGKQSNNKISSRKQESIMSIVRRHYYDFGPTLTCEKLDELHGIIVSRETVRKWMIYEGLWRTKKKKKRQIHQLRDRRTRYGEMIQIDGSPHDWFEGRRAKCTLIVYIDDATGRLMKLKFFESETTESYMDTAYEYIKEFGRPRVLYSDRHGIFKVNQKDTIKGDELAQLGRAMKTLDIELITANSPQAKGRVEKANRLLQDRLVEELRLKKIDTIDAANEFLDKYQDKLNSKFAVKPKSSEDAHRKIPYTDNELNLIFSLHTKRTISKNLELQYKNIIYQIKIAGLGLTMRNSKATVCEDFKGNITISI